MGRKRKKMDFEKKDETILPKTKNTSAFHPL